MKDKGACIQWKFFIFIITAIQLTSCIGVNFTAVHISAVTYVTASGKTGDIPFLKRTFLSVALAW
jgi:hypothetical protein